MDIVVAVAPSNNELSFLTLTNAKSYKNVSESAADCSEAIFSPKFEQVVRQTANSIIASTFTNQS